MTPPEIRASEVSTAWRMAARAVLAEGGQSFHLAVRIGNDDDHSTIRADVSQLQETHGLAGVETVSNTIFPAAMAAASDSPADLAERYRAVYPRLRSLQPNRFGTYFGRMVSHPGGDAHADQLNHVIEKLRQTEGGNNWSSRYEMPIYHPASDSTRPMGFPCMSHCAFHLDAENDSVNLLAVYRNQYIVERAYGNYLGLVRLRNYVAAETNRQPGELIVVVGHAEVETAKTATRRLLDNLDSDHGAP